MPNTREYARLISEARRRPGRRAAPLLEQREGRCPDCGYADCQCDENESPLEGRLERESLETAEILAATDPHSFAFLAECEGLQVATLRELDPLQREAQVEDVAAIAGTVNEDPNEHDDGLDHYQSEMKQIGAEYGFILS